MGPVDNYDKNRMGRPLIIMEGQSFINLDGEHQTDPIIKRKKKWEKIGKLIAHFKEKDEYLLTEELCKILYPDKVHRDYDTGLIVPDHRAYQSIHTLLHVLRKKVIKQQGNPNYSVKAKGLEGFAPDEIKHIQVYLQSGKEYDYEIRKTKKQETAYKKLAEQLEIIKALPKKRRQKNLSEVLNS